MKRTILPIVLLGFSSLAFLAGCAAHEKMPEESAALQTRSETSANYAENNGDENRAVSNQNGNMNAAHFDLTHAAQSLGLSEDALLSALGDGWINNQTDFAAAAEELGISEDVLRDALLNNPMNGRNEPSGEEKAGNGNEQSKGGDNGKAGGQGNQKANSGEDWQGEPQGYQDIDFANAALTLGIPEEELRAAVDGNLGYGPPDFEKAAETLGIGTDELLAAIGHE
ncbi:MAG: hypothetical protein J7L66_00205 [Anaerolineaceae bacterium]|nr:hypothetical protein [Anaerolineaceae bacterium]